MTNIINLPPAQPPDDLIRRFGVTTKELRAQVKPLMMFMNEHGIPDLTILRMREDPKKVMMTINGVQIK